MYFACATDCAHLGTNMRYKWCKMKLRLLTLALSMTSILGSTTNSYSPTIAVSYSAAVAATLTPQNWTSAGPCSNYTVLSESWRNVNEPRTSLHCDNLLAPGKWYRFMPPAGNVIPETMPPPNSCGTDAPMWLNGAHPRDVSIVPVERQLCANWAGNPCLWSTTVKVALCLGGYYVYMAPLSAAPVCDLAWCAVDTNGTLSPRGICEQQGNFYCSQSQLCVAYYHRCNGYSYCSYGEDEAGCNSSSTSSTTASFSSCGGTVYGSGYVRSPHYPSSYDNDLRCNWTLIASPYNGTIVLQFYAFSTDSCCDFVSIYSTNGTLVNRYSGTSLPSSMVLGSTAVVSFTTDSSVTSSGFSIWFSTSVAPSTTLSPRDSCEQQGYFYCALSNLCIAFWRRCDGSAYCYYGEDEAGCGVSSTVRTSQQNSVRVRLIATANGQPASGIVEVMYNGVWGIICDDLWDIRAARVVCRQLGYADAASALDNLVATPARVDFLLDNVVCSGTESSIEQCSHAAWGQHNCGSSEVAGVICQYAQASTTFSQRDSCLAQGNFYCEYSRECIAMWRRCDGYSYCVYGEDESGCGTPTATYRPPSTAATHSDSCEDLGNFYCEYSRQCIERWRRCDGYSNCVYGEDESGCGYPSTAARPPPSTFSQRDSCLAQGNFYCEYSRQCITMWRRCDGYSNCNYGEDESGCGNPTTTSRPPSTTFSQRDSCVAQGNFYCEYSRECIAMWRRCDGYSHCVYGEDESGCGTPMITSRPHPSRPSASQQPQGSFIAASGFAQAFLQLSKSSASELPRGSWIVVFVYVTALLFRLPCSLAQ